MIMETNTAIYNIYFDSDIEIVVMQWNGYATSSQFRKGTELMLKTLVENICKKVLADIRNMVLIAMDDQRWLEDYFLPKAINAGFSEIAIIKPTSYFNKVAVETVSYKMDKEKLRIDFFDSEDEATQWILRDKQ